MSAMGACRARLPDGRMHFQHGPIDLVVGADGEPAALDAAHADAWERFSQVLAELVSELPLLRRPVCTRRTSHAAGTDDGPMRGPIARSMWAACRPFARETITPMAAVAGAVAQHVLAYYRRDGIERAWVNNGGDIAWWFASARSPSLAIGLFADLARLDAACLRASMSRGGLRCDGRIVVDAAMRARGAATSGWRGRSFSLGIADAVTVLARTAAEADAAATIIANAVDLDDPRIVRRPACSLKDDSDLGERLVTVAVPTLPRDRVDEALVAGMARARALRDAGLIQQCTLICQRRVLHLDARDGTRDAPSPVAPALAA